MPSEQRGAPDEPCAGATPFRLRAESTADTKLAQIAKRALEKPKLKFTAVMHHFSEANLEQCYRELDGKKALGVDGISKEEYTNQGCALCCSGVQVKCGDRKSPLRQSRTAGSVRDWTGWELPPCPVYSTTHRKTGRP
jgi:hypothetical protein